MTIILKVSKGEKYLKYSFKKIKRKVRRRKEKELSITNY